MERGHFLGWEQFDVVVHEVYDENGATIDLVVGGGGTQGNGKWDPTKKCKISLKSYHGRYVCAEGNGTINANRQHCRFVMVYYFNRVNRNGVRF